MSLPFPASAALPSGVPIRRAGAGIRIRIRSARPGAEAPTPIGKVVNG